LAGIFLLGAGAAQAVPIVICGTEACSPTNNAATEVLNVDVAGFDTPFNVTFPFTTADELYGTGPIKDWDFDTEATANAAVDAVRAASTPYCRSQWWQVRPS